jgi:hypothetical protein
MIRGQEVDVDVEVEVDGIILDVGFCFTVTPCAILSPLSLSEAGGPLNNPREKHT